MQYLFSSFLKMMNISLRRKVTVQLVSPPFFWHRQRVVVGSGRRKAPFVSVRLQGRIEYPLRKPGELARKEQPHDVDSRKNCGQRSVRRSPSAGDHVQALSCSFLLPLPTLQCTKNCLTQNRICLEVTVFSKDRCLIFLHGQRLVSFFTRWEKSNSRKKSPPPVALFLKTCIPNRYKNLLTFS